MSLTPSTLAAVAVGGAAGSVLRLVVATTAGQWLGHGFPFGTLIVNAVGCFVMGVLAQLAATVWHPSDALRGLLFVGLLGGFTTFSSFTLDIGGLVARNELGAAAIYLFGSLALTIGGFFVGLVAVRSFFPVSL